MGKYAGVIKVAMVAATGVDRELGYNNDLLWGPGTQKADMKRFRDLTRGLPVIMGRRTWESIPERYRPLPGRLNIILSRTMQQPTHPMVAVCKTPEDAIDQAVIYCAEKGMEDKKVAIIGGGEIYKEFLKDADEFHLTIIDQEFPQADTFFPEYEDVFAIKDVKPYPKDEDNHYAYSFLTLEARDE